MKLYDITQELFSSHVYPGDTPPRLHPVARIREGAGCNVSDLSMCAHNGTHVDAPCHFIDGAPSIEMLPLERLIGPCRVAALQGAVTAASLAPLLVSRPERLLLKGSLSLTPEAADAIVQAGVRLLGVESQSVAPEEDPVTVHTILLGRDVIALEGLVLTEVPPGDYFLFAAPLKLGGSDGAPCRAVLADFSV